MGKTVPEKQAIRLDLHGKMIWLEAIAALLSSQGAPTRNSSDFKNLMIKIYWEDEVERYAHLLKTKSKK